MATTVRRAEENPLPLVLPLVLLVGGAATAAVIMVQANSRKKATAEAAKKMIEEGAKKKSAYPSPQGGLVAVMPGVYTRQGVVLNQRMLAYLPRLRAKFDELLQAGGFPPANIVITSGFRSADAQARAMIKNWQNHGGPNGGYEYLVKLYRGNTAARVGPLMPNQAAVAAEVGRATVSDHQASSVEGGDAIDLDLTGGPGGSMLSGSNQGYDIASGQQGALLAAGKATAGKAIHEDNHIHIGKLGATGQIVGLATEAGLPELPEPVLNNLPYIVSSIGIGLIIFTGVWTWRARQ